MPRTVDYVTELIDMTLPRWIERIKFVKQAQAEKNKAKRIVVDIADRQIGIQMLHYEEKVGKNISAKYGRSWKKHEKKWNERRPS